MVATLLVELNSVTPEQQAETLIYAFAVALSHLTKAEQEDVLKEAREYASGFNTNEEKS
jgi:hypothetical protein